MITVLETRDPALLALAQSFLQAEGIQYHVTGECMYKTIAGRLMVFPEDADRARAKIAEIEWPEH